jgi:hypothetical protein
MQTTTSSVRRRRWLIALLPVASMPIVTVKKFFDYTAASVKDKESDFVYKQTHETQFRAVSR